MSVKKEISKDSLRESVFEAVKYAEMVLSQFACVVGAYEIRNNDEKVLSAITTIMNFLVKKELDAYRQLFSVTAVIGDDKNETAKKKALRRFFDHGFEIMHMWNLDLTYSRSYAINDEKQTRAIFDQAKKEWEEKHGNKA